MSKNLVRRSISALLCALMLFTASVGFAPDASADTARECVTRVHDYGNGWARLTRYCRIVTVDWENSSTTVTPWKFAGSVLVNYE